MERVREVREGVRDEGVRAGGAPRRVGASSPPAADGPDGRGGSSSIRVGANDSSDSASEAPHDGQERLRSSATGVAQSGHFMRGEL